MKGKKPWNCWVCGQWSDDYENTIWRPDNATLGEHLMSDHGITEAFREKLDVYRQRLLEVHGIHVGAEGVTANLMHYPDDKDWEMAAWYSVVNIPDSDGILPLSCDVWKTLHDVWEGRKLPNAMEALTFGFIIEGVSRACSHQLVRTRNGATFLQQSSRDSDLSRAAFRMPVTIFGDGMLRKDFIEQVSITRRNYRRAVKRGIPYQDARFQMMEAVTTYLIAIYNVPALTGLAHKRLQNHMQWEINAVLRYMKHQLLAQGGTTEAYAKHELVPTCEMKRKCQLATNTLSPCGKFPNVYLLEPNFPVTSNPHGYVFDEKSWRR